MQNQPYTHYSPPQNSDNRPNQPPTNGLAIASLVLGVTGWIVILVGPLLAIIFGHIARSQIKHTGQKGSGLALAGLILGYIQLFIISVGIISAIALPAYLDYTTRAQMVDADSYLVQARDQLGKRIAEQPDNIASINIPTEDLTISGMENYWREFRVDNGILYARFNDNNSLPANIQGNILRVIPQVSEGKVIWLCESRNDIRKDLLPPSCKSEEISSK